MREAPADLRSLVGHLVAVLYLAGEGADRRAVQRALGLTGPQLAQVVEAARQAKLPGLLVQEHGDLLRLVTHPDAEPSVRRFVAGPGAVRLSAAAVEALAIVAYHQPVTRGQVSEARGVSSDGPIATLVQHGLIAEAGRAPGPGRPILYETTPEFLSLVGIASLRELPALHPRPDAL